MKTFYAAFAITLLASASPAAQISAVLGSTPSLSGGGNSFAAALSADARHVVFISHANNLATNDSMGSWLDLYLRDRHTGKTQLLSVNKSGSGGAADNIRSAAVSSNGMWVAFATAAKDLVEGDADDTSDIFLRDVAMGVTYLISAGTNGLPPSLAWGNPIISEDGRFVVFQDESPTFNPGGMNRYQSIFVHDRIANSNRLVNVGLTFPNPELGAEGSAHTASMTPDGSRIAYAKSATNFLTNPARVSGGEIYLRNFSDDTTWWLSTGVSNTQAANTYICYNPTISANGQAVVFKVNNGGSPTVLYHRTQLTTPGISSRLVASNATIHGWAQLGFDGRFVAYEAIDGIRVWDAQTDSNRLVMANITGARTCTQPVISAVGNVTVFLVASNEFTTLYRHDYANDTTTVAAMNAGGAPAIVHDSVAPFLSADGSVNVFDSVDNSLVGGDSNRACDVFACSSAGAVIELISVRASEHPSLTPPVASFRSPTSISANGRAAAISAVDWNAADTNGSFDLYTRDLVTGHQTFLGTPTNQTTQPVFSADGRFIAYLSTYMGYYAPFLGSQTAHVLRRDLLTGETILIHSNATWDTTTSTTAISPDGNLVAFVDRNSLPFGNGNPNIYLRDVLSGAVSLVSTQGSSSSPFGNPAGQGVSNEPQFSPDGRWLLFASTAPNLTTNGSSTVSLYARDLLNHRTLLVSPLRFPNDKRAVSVSADSRFVACIDLSVSPQPRALVFDLLSGSTTRLPHSIDARSVSISADGHWVAFDGKPAFGQHFSIFVQDTISQSTDFASVPMSNTNISTGNSSHPQISHDGRYVVFASDATNLASGDNNNAKDVFIRDRLRGVTMLASVNRTGTGSGNGASLSPVLAADGRTLLFQSFASDLIEGDFNETADVFVLRLGGVDSDGDGMDDDWEAAYFGILARDGSGDFDEDGSNDRQEHQSGTNPTNAGSVFQVLRLTREGSRGTKLLWTATPGQAYRVEFKDDLASTQWTAVTDLVTAAGSTAVWSEGDGVYQLHRFYRVVLVP